MSVEPIGVTWRLNLKNMKCKWRREYGWWLGMFIWRDKR